MAGEDCARGCFFTDLRYSALAFINKTVIKQPKSAT
jgi:hypothetical protein